MIRKGAALSHDEVIEIHRLAKAGTYPQREIASMFATSQSHVSRILHAQTWEELIESEAGR
jgi:ParB-like chromosome segregation protein Spo0J